MKYNFELDQNQIFKFKQWKEILKTKHTNIGAKNFYFKFNYLDDSCIVIYIENNVEIDCISL